MINSLYSAKPKNHNSVSCCALRTVLFVLPTRVAALLPDHHQAAISYQKFSKFLAPPSQLPHLPWFCFNPPTTKGAATAFASFII